MKCPATLAPYYNNNGIMHSPVSKPASMIGMKTTPHQTVRIPSPDSVGLPLNLLSRFGLFWRVKVGYTRDMPNTGYMDHGHSGDRAKGIIWYVLRVLHH